ncbi:MAG: hypothetical protein QM754_04500 [Tepidisphaeraceae bacterium]
MAVDDVGTLVHEAHHVGQEFGRVLQVGVDDEDAVAGAQRQARRERQLMAVVAGEFDGFDARVVACQFRHQRPGEVFRAVVDEHEFVRPPAGPADVAEAAVRLAKALGLVVAGYDDRKRRH